MSQKRLWLGFASLVATYVVLSNIANFFVTQSIVTITVQPIVVSFLASIVGGAIARGRFVLIALATWAALWMAVGYMLYLIAAPTGNASAFSIVQHNWVAFSLSGVATAIGAYVGQAWATSRTHKAAAT